MRSRRLLSWIILFCVARMGLDTVAVAQWHWQNPVPQGNNLRSVCFVNRNAGWAAGDAGVLLKTTDGGITWNPGMLPDRLYAHNIFFHNENIGWVGGQASGGLPTILFRTSDGGATWQTSLEDPTDIRAIFFVNERTGWASGQGSRLWHTTNGGNNWQLQADFPFQFVHALNFVDSLRGWGAGAVNRRIRTTDGGNVWIIDTLSYSLWDIQFIDSLKGWQCGVSSIEATTDGGKTWQVQLNSGAIWSSIFMLDSLHGWAVSETDTLGNPFGLIVHTTNGGMLWTYQISPTQYSLKATYFLDSLSGIVVGNVATLLRTTDGGVQWQSLTQSVTSHSLFGIHIQDPLKAWIVGRQGTILRTSDGGSQWSVLTSGTTADLNDVCFVDPQSGWVVGDASTILRTTDNGNSWAAQTSPVLSRWRAVDFSQYPTGWIVGGGRLLRSTDGGNSWSAHPTILASGTSEVQFTSPSRGWIMAGDVISGSQQVVYRTTDGGASWISVVSNNSDSAYLSMSFVNDNTGWVSALRGGIFHTEDGGETWRLLYTPEPFGVIDFVDTQRGWGAASGNIFETTDGGCTWYSQQAPSAWIIQALKFQGPEIGWAAAHFGTVLHTTSGGSTFVEPIDPSHQIPIGFRVHQNYPNPFNPSTTVTYTIPVDGPVSLKVYDVLGREVRTLVDGFVSAGRHYVQVDGSGLASGVYVCRLAMPGARKVLAMKMILTK
ncbi:MAG: T9SS type A sorting domain-containing protein [Ignavibacteriae bacterium]|nr:T9SS type A sorting domain-containing protein [Ignavibacteriota bacterium]